ncbi:hypothetical protein ARALYDRAFT_915599 [Arabidopsis lyrata subsp. lyrata]|uniref:Uncharacterized protein n=1 Tax=Arabidopsis lyrata subsp. lyrata TaxID=81972 RepID=D7MHJ5_ARALL|nr:hypothetical protein ARALYDRAFT_915599 [Arabidopsis lyrata subsp. lyrata]
MASESAVNEINQVVEPVGDDDCVVYCIGSAFNCKKKMICPSCRKVEKGDWLYAAHPGQYDQPTFNLEHVLNDHLPISWENGPTILALPASSAWRGTHVLPNDVTHNIQNISNHPAMPNPLEPRNDFWVHDPSSEAGLDSEFVEQFSQRRLNDLLHGNGRPGPGQI